MRLAVRVGLECGACGFTEGHGPFCPMPDIEKWEQTQMHAFCPTCRENDVDRNDFGLLECRRCRTQYRKVNLPHERPLMEAHEWVPIRIPSESGSAAYFVLTTLGRGDFKTDRLLVAAKKRFIEMEVERATLH